jgi:hypothetical protein
MHHDPHAVLPRIQLKRAGTSRYPKVPVTAPGEPGKLALASNDKTSPRALIEACRAVGLSFSSSTDDPNRSPGDARPAATGAGMTLGRCGVIPDQTVAATMV